MQTSISRWRDTCLWLYIWRTGGSCTRNLARTFSNSSRHGTELYFEHKDFFCPLICTTGNVRYLVCFCDCGGDSIGGRRSHPEYSQGRPGLWHGDLSARRDFLRQLLLRKLSKKYQHYPDGNANRRIQFWRMVRRVHWYRDDGERCADHEINDLHRQLHPRFTADPVQSRCLAHRHWLWYGKFRPGGHFMRQRMFVCLCAEYCSHADRDSNGRLDVYRLVG